MVNDGEYEKTSIRSGAVYRIIIKQGRVDAAYKKEEGGTEFKAVSLVNLPIHHRLPGEYVPAFKSGISVDRVYLPLTPPRQELRRIDYPLEMPQYPNWVHDFHVYSSEAAEFHGMNLDWWSQGHFD